MHAYGLLPAEADREIYRTVLEGLSRLRPSIPCDADPARISAAVKAVLVDHPGLFWFEGRWAWRQAGAGGVVAPQYLYGAREIALARAELARLARSLAPLADEPPLKAAREVYGWLLDYADYGESDTPGQNAYDALVKRRAVCKGLSKAYQYLLEKLGVFATLEEGSLDGVGKHVWNVVGVGVRFTNADVSLGCECFSGLFGPEDARDRFRCFAVGDARLAHTHRWPSPKLSRLSCDFDIREEGAP